MKLLLLSVEIVCVDESTSDSQPWRASSHQNPRRKKSQVFRKTNEFGRRNQLSTLDVEEWVFGQKNDPFPEETKGEVRGLLPGKL